MRALWVVPAPGHFTTSVSDHSARRPYPRLPLLTPFSFLNPFLVRLELEVSVLVSDQDLVDAHFQVANECFGLDVERELAALAQMHPFFQPYHARASELTPEAFTVEMRENLSCEAGYKGRKALEQVATRTVRARTISAARLPRKGKPVWLPHWQAILDDGSRVDLAKTAYAVSMSNPLYTCNHTLTSCSLIVPSLAATGVSTGSKLRLLPAGPTGGVTESPLRFAVIKSNRLSS